MEQRGDRHAKPHIDPKEDVPTHARKRSSPLALCSTHARCRLRGAKAATRITFRIGGSLTGIDKALANRRNRRALKQDLRVHGEDTRLTPKLWTDWEVI
jgi:hypothetical protein